MTTTQRKDKHSARIQSAAASKTPFYWANWTTYTHVRKTTTNQIDNKLCAIIWMDYLILDCDCLSRKKPLRKSKMAKRSLAHSRSLCPCLSITFFFALSITLRFWSVYVTVIDLCYIISAQYNFYRRRWVYPQV